MVVTIAMIPQVSPFTVGPAGDFSQSDFDQYKIWAGLELKQADPGLDGSIYDYCHALLICHIYDISPQSKKTGFESEKIGDYSYKEQDASDSETSSYYKRYQQILRQWMIGQPTAGVEREDVDKTYPKKNFKLDQREEAVFL